MSAQRWPQNHSAKLPVVDFASGDANCPTGGRGSFFTRMLLEGAEACLYVILLIRRSAQLPFILLCLYRQLDFEVPDFAAKSCRESVGSTAPGISRPRGWGVYRRITMKIRRCLPDQQKGGEFQKIRSRRTANVPPAVLIPAMNNNYTEIVFVLDRSGSMQSCQEAAIAGFNRFLRGATAARRAGQIDPDSVRRRISDADQCVAGGRGSAVGRANVCSTRQYGAPGRDRPGG